MQFGRQNFRALFLSRSASISLVRLSKFSLGYLICNHSSLKGENINLKLIFSQHLLPITSIFDKATHTSTSNLTYKRERELPRKLAKRSVLLNSPLKIDTLQVVCLFVFSGMAASIISVIFSSSTSENLELEANVRLKLKNTAQFLCVIVITRSVTLISLGNGNSCDQS